MHILWAQAKVLRVVFPKLGLTPMPAKLVKPPLIVECPVNLEGRVVDVHRVGDHDLFIGDVLVEHIDPAALNESGSPDSAKLDPLIMLRGGFWRVGEQIRMRGYRILRLMDFLIKKVRISLFCGVDSTRPLFA